MVRFVSHTRSTSNAPPKMLAIEELTASKARLPNNQAETPTTRQPTKRAAAPCAKPKCPLKTTKPDLAQACLDSSLFTALLPRKLVDGKVFRIFRKARARDGSADHTNRAATTERQKKPISPKEGVVDWHGIRPALQHKSTLHQRIASRATPRTRGQPGNCYQ